MAVVASSTSASFITAKTWRRTVRLNTLEPFAHDLSLTPDGAPFMRCFFRVPLDADYLAAFTVSCEDPIIGAVGLHIDDYEIVTSSASSDQWKAVSKCDLARFTADAPLGCRGASWTVMFAVDIIDINKATKLVVTVDQYQLERDHPTPAKMLDIAIIAGPYPDLNMCLSTHRNKVHAYTTNPLKKTVPMGRNRFVAIPELGTNAFTIPRSIVGISSIITREPSVKNETITEQKLQYRNPHCWSEEDLDAPRILINGTKMMQAQKHGDEWHFPLQPIPMTIMSYAHMAIVRNNRSGDAFYPSNTVIEFDNVVVAIPVDGKIPFTLQTFIELIPDVRFQNEK
jgi:hypothetical protein